MGFSTLTYLSLSSPPQKKKSAYQARYLAGCKELR